MTDRWQFAKVGMAYRCWADDIQTEFYLSHVKRSRGEINGTLRVSANLAGIKTVKGVLHLASFNVLSSSTRSSLSKTLGTRTPGFDIDWFDGLEWLCQHVVAAEEGGDDMVILTDEPPKPNSDHYLVEPLIVKNEPSLLFGPPGAGKSFVAIGCGLSVAAGREIIPGIAPSVKGPVLYLDWETSHDVIHDRAWSICKGHDFPMPKTIRYRPCRKPLSTFAEDLSVQVATGGIVLVIIDSSAYAMGVQGEFGDANESVLRMHEALRYLNTTTFILDHVNKTDQRGKAGTGSPYGSAYKRAAARVSWEIRKETSVDDSLRSTLYHDKENDGRAREPMGISINWLDGGGVRFGRDGAAVASTESAITAEAAILELLDGAEMEIGKVAATLTNFTEANVRRTMYRMRDRGVLVLADRGRFKRA